MRRRIITVLMLGAAVAACSTGEEAVPTTSAAAVPSSTTSTSAVTTTTTVAATETTVPKPPPVEVRAFDYRYEGIPESLRVDTRLSLFNTSSAEFHEMVVFLLDPSEQRTVEELSQLSLGDLTAFGVGRIQSVVFAMPGNEQYTYADGPPVLGEEGRYLIFCAINVGTDPIDARNGAARGPADPIDGVPRHYQVGMMTEIIVTD